MKERDLYPDTQKWLKKNLKTTCVIELKIVKGDKFYLRELKQHQRDSLMLVKHGTASYKLPDVGFDRKPFDIFLMNNCPAYLGLVFYEPKKKKRLYLIDIDVIPFDKKSLSELEVIEIAFVFGDI